MNEPTIYNVLVADEGTIPVHRLVAETFLVDRALRDDEYVVHINGDTQDNRLVNLRLLTPEDGDDVVSDAQIVNALVAS
jgi:hypothetical protein